MAPTYSSPTMRPARVGRTHRRAGRRGRRRNPCRRRVRRPSTPNRFDASDPTTPHSGATERDRPLFGARAIYRTVDRPAGRPTVDQQPRISAAATTPISAEYGRLALGRRDCAATARDGHDDLTDALLWGAREGPKSSGHSRCERVIALASSAAGGRRVRHFEDVSSVTWVRHIGRANSGIAL
jgi:hypothetical protein